MKPVYAYENLRYGFFVHYIACQALYRDGSSPKTIDEAAEGFDVPGFVNDLAEMNIEYLILTAWHFRMMPLYPSAVTERWRPGCSVRRDLLGEIIDGVREKGIRVILYTHPRDGHDFVGEERINCGWGEGIWPDAADTPNPDTFDYQTWNRYVMELYDELLARYGSRIDGIYTDGMGPGRYVDDRSLSYEFPIVSYLDIRRKVKATNPDIVIIQNDVGHLFSNDYVMPEGFFGYEKYVPDTSRWPACEKALAMSPFAGWTASGRYGEDVRYLPDDDLARFTIFQATCASAGGMCWASGPYCGGGWDVGVMEAMRRVGAHMKRLGEGVRSIVPSTSWPTVSGDTLVSRNFQFACSSRDREYEYIHIMRLPEDGVIRLPASADGARFAYPRSLAAGIAVYDFRQDENGVSFRLEGTPDELDTIIRLKRENNLQALTWAWVNDTDKRIRYSGEDWQHHLVYLDYGNHILHDQTLGCYEYDSHTATRAGARMDTCFEGEEIELYGVTDPKGGSADVLIDDMLVTTLNLRSSERQVRRLLFQSGALYGGIHTFSVVVKGDGSVEFDALRIAHRP